MRKNGVGGAKTYQIGEIFEEETTSDLIIQLKNSGYSSLREEFSEGNKIRFMELINDENQKLQLYFKGGIYQYFFTPQNINYKNYFSLRLEPDTAIYAPHRKVLTIIEKKQQTVSGSVAEKLQTCDFKQKYYETLCLPHGIEVDLVWQLGTYFKKREKSLKTVFEYMVEKKSKYYFDELPIAELRL